MISTKGRYALRVLIDLAENENGSNIPLKDIAARQDISKKYLEIIVKEMVAGGLITGASGKGGGYRLLRKPEDYPVGEVLELMEGTLSSVACLARKLSELFKLNVVFFTEARKPGVSAFQSRDDHKMIFNRRGPDIRLPSRIPGLFIELQATIQRLIEKLMNTWADA